MKNSEVKWIGDIPDDWNVTKLKYLICSVSSGGTPDSSNDFYYSSDDSGIPWVTISDISNEQYIQKTIKTITPLAVKDKKLKLYKPGTLLLAMYASVGKTAILSNPATINQAILAMECNNSRFLTDFAKYCFMSYEPYLNSESNGTTQFNLNANKVINLFFPSPSVGEQKRITTILNRQCSIIDSLIDNETKQIKKLEEYKKAVVTKAVTKGLDLSTKMKDSEVEWIGEIRADCVLSKVKGFYEVTLGKMLQPKPQTHSDCFLRYLCAANIDDGNIKLEVTKEMWFSADEIQKFNLKKGDLLVVEGGDVGDTAIVSDDMNDFGFQNSIHRVRSLGGNLFFLRYYLLFLKSIGYFDYLCNKATLAHLTKTKLENLPLILYSKEEQRKIADFLDKKCSEIQNVILLKKSKIEKLQQYKKSLIYEYVTGKKAVEA